MAISTSQVYFSQSVPIGTILQFINNPHSITVLDTLCLIHSTVLAFIQFVSFHQQLHWHHTPFNYTRVAFSPTLSQNTVCSVFINGGLLDQHSCRSTGTCDSTVEYHKDGIRPGVDSAMKATVPFLN